MMLEHTNVECVDDVDKCNRRWKMFFLFSIVANVLALGTLLGLHLYSQFRSEDDLSIPTLPLSDDLCIPCQKETSLYDYKTETLSGRYICCYNNSDIQRAVKTMLREEIRFTASNSLSSGGDGWVYSPRHIKQEPLQTEKDLTWWRSRHGAAHLYLKPTTEKTNRLQWTNNSDYVTTFVSPDLKIVDESKIEITERGVYFIYSAISVDFNLMEGTDNSAFYHNILSENVNLPNTGKRIEMMRKYGGDVKDETDRLYTSFVCGALFLKEGDQLSAVFSSPPFIYQFPYANYFGIFKL